MCDEALNVSSLPPTVPGAPPRRVEVDNVNSTALRVSWKPPLQQKQHGQIRGYQVVYSRLENGEPRGQPIILDVALPEAQVLTYKMGNVQPSHIVKSQKYDHPQDLGWFLYIELLINIFVII